MEALTHLPSMWERGTAEVSLKQGSPHCPYSQRPPEPPALSAVLNSESGTAEGYLAWKQLWGGKESP